MKKIYEQGDWVISILDYRNYTLHDKTKPIERRGKIQFRLWYFSNPISAVLELSRRCANETCSDLDSWVKDYRTCAEQALNILELK